ncbi:MAG: flagellar basal body rod protein FlgB [Thermodesulfobacteriota bacterium]|nr:flagellar basal body rod protein FlgB [Thermodesulfobacteriota bacterium]
MADTSFFIDQTSRLLEKAIDITAKRHNVITRNIANVNSVGYTPSDIDFKAALQQELNARPGGLTTTHPDHFSHSTLNDEVLPHKKAGPNGQLLDSVSIDEEMTNLVENNIKYKTSVEFMLRKISKLRNVIAEGGK